MQTVHDYRQRTVMLAEQDFVKVWLTALVKSTLSQQRSGTQQLRRMVGATGIEPVTPAMSRRCSPAELRAHPTSGF